MKKQLLTAVCAAMLVLSGCGKQALDSSGTVQDFPAENHTEALVSENTEAPDTAALSPENTKMPKAPTAEPMPGNTKVPEAPTAEPMPENTKTPEAPAATPISEAAKAPEADAAVVPETTKAPGTDTATSITESSKDQENVSEPEEPAQSQETGNTQDKPVETSNPAPDEAAEAPTEQPTMEETPAPAEETQPPAPTEAPAVCNHRFRQYCEPTCASTYWVEERCAYCGETNGVRFETGPDLHNYVDAVVSYGNCSEPAIISHVCSGCGASLPDTTGYSESARNDHDFQPYSGSEIDWEYRALITYDCDKCTRCGKEINWVQTGCDILTAENYPEVSD